jgi:hypothetical protein
MVESPQTVPPGQSAVRISPGPRMKAALALAILADIVQIVLFPIFFAGVESPPDDIIDLSMAGILSWLLGWHWEFLPTFAGKLIPGVDLAPLWTLAVANVYRKSRPRAATVEPEPGDRTTR